MHGKKAKMSMLRHIKASIKVFFSYSSYKIYKVSKSYYAMRYLPTAYKVSGLFN